MSALDQVRMFNKHGLNPLMPRGRKYRYALLIEHTGHRSGTQHTAPVMPDRVAGGFIGTHVDWLGNVMTAGRATLVVQGERHVVTQPQVVDAAAAAHVLSPHRQRVFACFGIKHHLKVNLQHSNAA